MKERKRQKGRHHKDAGINQSVSSDSLLQQIVRILTRADDDARSMRIDYGDVVECEELPDRNSDESDPDYGRQGQDIASTGFVNTREK